MNIINFVKSVLKRLLTSNAIENIRKIKRGIKGIYYFGFKVKCPCCNGNFRKFLPGDVIKRPNALCPKCGSLERHRLLYLYLKNQTNFFIDNLKVLDIAPMDFFQRICLKQSNLKYISVDLFSSVAMLKMDITNMTFDNDSFGVIICYHVLEHISGDIQAMKEIYRVLKPTGWAILQVPILREKTFEDPNIVPEDYERVYGQKDHVRIYGLDFKERLESVGFEVKVDPYVKTLDESTRKRFGLQDTEDIYFCKKSPLK